MEQKHSISQSEAHPDEENFDRIRGAARSASDGVDTYSEPSIKAGNKVVAKIIPSDLMRRILFQTRQSERGERRRRYLRRATRVEALTKYGAKLFHQESMVEMVIVISSSTSSSTRTVSRDVNMVVFVSTARRLISCPSIC